MDVDAVDSPPNAESLSLLLAVSTSRCRTDCRLPSAVGSCGADMLCSSSFPRAFALAGSGLALYLPPLYFRRPCRRIQDAGSNAPHSIISLQTPHALATCRSALCSLKSASPPDRSLASLTSSCHVSSRSVSAGVLCVPPRTCLLPPILPSTIPLSWPQDRGSHKLVRGLLRDRPQGTVLEANLQAPRYLWPYCKSDA